MTERQERGSGQLQPGQHQQRALVTPTGTAPGYRVRRVKVLPSQGQNGDFVFSEADNSICVWVDDKWVCGGGSASSGCYTYVVDADGGGTHTTLSSAISAFNAMTGGNARATIFICPGTYLEPAMTIDTGSIFDDWLTIRGAGKESVVIAPNLSTITTLLAFSGTRTHVTLDGITFRTASSGSTGSDLVSNFANGAYVTINNCRFERGGSTGITTGLAGPYVPFHQYVSNCEFFDLQYGMSGGSGNEINNCFVVNCSFSSCVWAVYAGIGWCSFQNCLFAGNDISMRLGLGTRHVSIEGCSFQDEPIAIDLSDTVGGIDISISNNHFYSCQIGIECRGDSINEGLIIGLSIVGNTFDAVSTGTAIGINAGRLIGIGRYSPAGMVITGNAFRSYDPNQEMIDCTMVSNINFFGYVSNLTPEVAHNVRISENSGTLPDSGTGHTAGGGPSAPNDAQFLTLIADPDLPNERVLTPGIGIQLVDGGPNNLATITAEPIAGVGITVTPGGVNAPVTIAAIPPALVIARSYLPFGSAGVNGYSVVL